ncbi:MAG: hypothetical protein K6B39_08925 [Lachnospiraceae bacterium]|nr:hypothetical protein [Lachnospiraceae bacterium]
MGAFEGLNSFFNGNLHQIAMEYGYSDANLCILMGDETTLQRQFSRIYANLLSCRHQSDRRTPMEYGRDLVASWVFEDYFLREMQNHSVDISLSGGDSRREILSNRNVSASTDYTIIAADGRRFRMELVNDYQEFWKKHHVLHLRDFKYRHLERSQSFLLAISMSNQAQQYFIFDFHEDIPFRYIPSHKPFGEKPAYEISIPGNAMYDFSIDSVKNQLTTLMNY